MVTLIVFLGDGAFMSLKKKAAANFEQTLKPAHRLLISQEQ